MLGEAPSRATDRHRHPLSGETGRRLASWAGLLPAEFHRRVECRNLLDRWPGPRGHGADLPRGEARAAWMRLRPALAGRAVVLLGARLAELAGVAESPPFTWREEFHVEEPHIAFWVCWMPHPSGLNRFWNARAHVEAARAFLHGLTGQPPPRPLPRDEALPLL